MTIGQFLKNATDALVVAGVDSARLDCLVLLEDVLKKDRSHLLAHPEIPLSDAQLTRLNNYVTQRKTHVPLAYIRGKICFFGRDFYVNTDVLVPRPETESIIELLLELDLPAQAGIADIGCGSGCIGITAALEMPDVHVSLYDIDSAALAVAEQNAKMLKANVTLKRQDLLTNCDDHFDVILANLPYVPKAYTVNAAAKHEPSQALYSGPDGLDHYRRIWKQIAARTDKPTRVIIEALPTQHAQLTEFARNASYALTGHKDFVLAFSIANA
jgi:release factor glutamine methyltransferase